MVRQKTATSMRLSARTMEYLAALCDRFDTTQTAIVEKAVRELAEREGLAVKPGVNQDTTSTGEQETA